MSDKNLPDEVQNELPPNLKVNRKQYFVLNIKDIIRLRNGWIILLMYVMTKVPKKFGPNNSKTKHTIDELYDLIIALKKDNDQKWAKQEEFNKWVKDVFRFNNLKNTNEYK